MNVLKTSPKSKPPREISPYPLVSNPMSPNLTPKKVLNLLALSVIVNGCESAPSPAAEQTTAAFGTPAFSTFPAPGALCSQRRMVVINQSGVCPGAAGWSAESVFASASAPALTKYCLYQFTGSGEPTNAQIAMLPGAERHPDCLIAHPTSDPWGIVHQAFLDQLELPDLQKADSGPGPATTLVAMIDSSEAAEAKGAAVQGNNSHAYILGRIIREMGCKAGPHVEAPCVVHLHHELALPWRFDGAQWSAPSGGGDFGYQTDVARAINRAVDAFGTSGASRLVINLSLGWVDHPNYGGQSPRSNTDRTPARAVFTALLKARCKRAVILAAAGNWSGGSNYNEGPLYPAAWATLPSPTELECMTELGGFTPHYTDEVPLLEAVGGVDGRDLPLSNARPGSTPRLVAPSFMGTADNLHLAGSNPYLIGTSVGTAVVSAAAAIALAYAPDQDTRALLTTIYDSGTPLGRFTDPALCTTTCPEVHRVSVCRTLQSACKTTSGGLRPGCTPQSCTDRPAFVDASANVSLSSLASPDIHQVIGPMFSYVGGLPTQCGPITTHYRPIADLPPANYPCPDRQYYGGAAHPDVSPQPSGIPCRVCGYFEHSGSLGVQITIDPSSPSVPLHHPSLVITTMHDEFRYALYETPGLEKLQGGVVYRFTGMRLPPDTIQSGRLVGRSENGEAWAAELMHFR